MAVAGDKVPKIVEGVDIRSLPLDATSGFVLSRVDGMLSVREIGDVTGLGLAMVEECIARLLEVGAISYGDAAPERPRRPRSHSPGTTRRLGEPAAAPGQQARGAPRGPVSRTFSRPKPKLHTVPPPSGNEARGLYDPAELEEEGVDLSLERRRRVLDVFYRLEKLTYYELLGVGRDATRNEIRDSYFKISKSFHPDTVFGKSLGSYKQKMEKIFVAATNAYETLSRKRRRAEYDATLPPPTEAEEGWRDRKPRGAVRATGDNRPPSRSTPPPEPPPDLPSKDSPESANAVIGTAPTERPPSSDSPPIFSPPPPPKPPVASSAPPSAPQGRVAPPPPPPSEGRIAASPPPPPPEAMRPPSGPPDPAKAQRTRELLERRLGAGSGAAPRVPAPGTPKPPPIPAAAHGASSPGPGAGPAKEQVLRGLAGALKGTAKVTGGVSMMFRHLAQAEALEAKGEMEGALSALRLAKALETDDREALAKLAEIERRIAERMAPEHEARAEAAERAGQWPSAALSWLRVVEGRPGDPRAIRRTVHALMEAKLDLRRARDLAKQAVELEPESVSSRITLARVYIAASMEASARRELETATKLDPGNEIVENLLSELN